MIFSHGFRRPICNKLPLCLALLLLALFPSRTRGNLHFDSLTTDNGLPQNSVQAILQSRDGYLWVATSDGLARFNGLNFTVFNTGNTDGIESNRFTCIYEDDQGTLWLGTEDGGLNVYQEGEFRTVIAADRLPDKLIVGIYKDPDGGVLVFTNKGLIQVPHADSSEFIPKDLPRPGPTCKQETDSCWYLQRPWLRLLTNGIWKSHRIPEGLTDDDISHVRQDREGSLWIVVRGLRLIRIREGQIDSYNLRANLPRGVDAAKVGFTSIYEDRQGDLWIATANMGLIL